MLTFADATAWVGTHHADGWTVILVGRGNQGTVTFLMRRSAIAEYDAPALVLTLGRNAHGHIVQVYATRMPLPGAMNLFNARLAQHMLNA